MESVIGSTASTMTTKAPMTEIALIFILLVVYQLKHFFADYPLQREFMLKKFHADPKIWVPALSAHAGVHALFTLIIAFAVLGYHPLVWMFAILDFVVHFTMDRIKASPNLLGRYKPLDASGFMNMKSILMIDAKDAETARAAQRALSGNTYFWWALGFDQMVHHLTHYAIIYILVTQ